MKKKINLFLCLCMVITIIYPRPIHAETLQDYIDKVNKYTKELQDKKDKIASNDAEVKKIQIEIANIETQMEKIKNEQKLLQEAIEKNNQEIKNKEKETKNLVHYAQVSEGNNFYLDYVFGADNLTDMVYRMALVEQISSYNEKVVNDLNKLIEDNKNKKEELTKKDNELKKLEKDLNVKKDLLNEDSANIREGMPSVEEQIKQAQKMVTLYKNKGCEPNDVIGVDCAVIPKATPKPTIPSTSVNGSSNVSNVASTGSFIRPYENGYVTSNFGGRTFDDFHYGIDLSTSVNRYSTKIYPIASGVIYHIGYDIYGAKIVRIAHNYNGKIVGSTYVHLASFAPNIYEGMEVGVDDYIGIMGETGLAYGIHLHLEVSDCPYLYAGSNCYSWSSYIDHLQNNWQDPAKYISFPSAWSVR